MKSVEITTDSELVQELIDARRELINAVVKLGIIERTHAETMPSEHLHDHVKAGRIITRCLRCNRPLTNPASVAAGYGPVCQRAGP